MFKWKQAMFDIIFCFIVMHVRSLNSISEAINMFKWKWKEWCLIYSVCKYSEMTDVIKYAAVCRITGLASSRPRDTLPSLTREARTTEDTSLTFTYLVLRNTRRPNIRHQTISLIFSVLRPRRKHRQQQVWGGKKKFLGHIFPGNFGGKASSVS